MSIENENGAYEPKTKDGNMTLGDFEKLYNHRENVSEPNVSFDSPILLKRMRTSDQKDVLTNSELEARNNRMRSISEELSALNSNMQNIKEVGVSYRQKEEKTYPEPTERQNVRAVETERTERTAKASTLRPTSDLPKTERKIPIYREEIKEEKSRIKDEPVKAEKKEKPIQKRTAKAEKTEKPIKIRTAKKKSIFSDFNIEKFLKLYITGTIFAIAIVITVSILVLTNTI